MAAPKAINLSPTALNLFKECPRCFWLEKKLGFRRPPPYPYALNSAVDDLLKREYDGYRSRGELHPLFAAHDIQARLFGDQALLNQWRNNFKGIRYFDPELQATLFGAVDDILEFPGNRLAPLDFKSTGSSRANIYDRFQLQMDAYTLLLEKNNYPTTHKGYLAFYIVDKNSGFKDRLPFRTELLSLNTAPEKAAEIFGRAVGLLRQEQPPPARQNCAFCVHIAKVKGYYNSSNAAD